MRRLVIIGALSLTLPLAGCAGPPAKPAPERELREAVVLVDLTGLT